MDGGFNTKGKFNSCLLNGITVMLMNNLHISMSEGMRAVFSPIRTAHHLAT